MSYNKQILIGNLGADPIIRATGKTNADGTPARVANMSLATNRKIGEAVETTWHRIVVFGRMVDAIERLYRKGKQIMVEGETRKRKYEADGETREVTEVVVSFGGTCQLMGPAPADRAVPPAEVYDDDVPTDDIPF